MDTQSVFNIGQRNCVAMRKIFWKAGVIVHAEETGGKTARTMRFEMASGRVFLRSPDGSAPWVVSGCSAHASPPGP